MRDYEAEFNIQATRFYLRYLLEQKYNAKNKKSYRWFYKIKLTNY